MNETTGTPTQAAVAGNEATPGIAPAAAAGGGQAEQKPFWGELPENMRGATAEETLRKLMPSWQGYHKEHSSRPPVPKDVSEYKFETSNEKLRDYVGDGQDPLMQAAGKMALELGVPVAKFSSAIESVFAPLVEAGVLPPPVNFAKDFEAKAKLLGFNQLDNAAKAGLEQAENELMGFAEHMAKQLKLSEPAQIELESLVLTPGGFELVRALSANMTQPGFALGGIGGSGGAEMSKEEIFALFNDPRAKPSSAKYDPAFLKKAEEAYEALRAGEGSR